jgi:hypothetical protein
MSADAGSGMRWPAIYLALVLAQTAASTVLFFAVFPLFQKVILQSGQPQVLDAATAVASMAAVLLVQACYWARYRYVPVWAPVRSVLAGHLLLFASRVSFFFGGALFSAIFFRHVPQLEMLPPLGQSLVKGCGVMVLLFTVFCYSLELERLGRAIEERAQARP